MGKIYLIKSYNESEVLYKIGFTRGKPENRLKALETGNPNEMELFKVFDTKFDTKMETALHNKFKYNRIKNEWFRLDKDDVNNFIIICESIEKNYTILAEKNYFFRKLLNRN